MVTGTLMNYYFHCKRQCYLAGNRLNLEDNSEQVKIGKALHEEKEAKRKNTEIQIGNVKIDSLTKDYIVEYKSKRRNEEYKENSEQPLHIFLPHKYIIITQHELYHKQARKSSNKLPFKN